MGIAEINQSISGNWIAFFTKISFPYKGFYTTVEWFHMLRVLFAYSFIPKLQKIKSVSLHFMFFIPRHDHT